MTVQPWDAALLSRIAHLHLRARRAVSGWQQGGHRSREHSSNIEFADYKEYAPGDPIKHVDWRVAARSDRLVIRRQHAETEVPVTLIFDASGDLGTGPPNLDDSKMGAGIVVAATLATLLQRRGDPVGLQVLAGHGCELANIPASRSSIGPIMRSLAQVEPAGEAKLAECFPRIGAQLPRRSVVILISDLMEEPGMWGPAVMALCQRGIDLRVLHLYDPAEWDIDFEGTPRFFSPEGGDEIAIDPRTARQEMDDVVATYLDEVRLALAQGRALHCLHSSIAQPDRAVRALLRGRL